MSGLGSLFARVIVRPFTRCCLHTLVGVAVAVVGPVGVAVAVVGPVGVAVAVAVAVVVAVAVAVVVAVVGELQS